MAGNNYEKKMRFTPYLPYGFCSKLATSLEGKSNHYARQLTLGDDPKETIALSEQHRRRLLDKVRYMGKKEYTCDIQMTCGTPPENRSFRRITKTGIAVLMEIPDDAMQYDEEDTEDCMPNNGDIKGSHFRSQSMSANELREFLHDYANDDSELGRQMFDEILYEAVTSAKATPLSYATDLAKQVKIKSNKYSANQKYSIWRLSHVIRMFQTAIEDYLDGKDFFVCCLPDQAPWYKALFPNCTIL